MTGFGKGTQALLTACLLVDKTKNAGETPAPHELRFIDPDEICITGAALFPWAVHVRDAG
jgi:hypothetical protein